MSLVKLRGLTWDDPRGWGPVDVVSRAFAATCDDDVQVEWDVQPLSGFESASVPELARRYDLINMDHPHVGGAVAAGALHPIDGVDDQYVGPSWESYVWEDQLWAVPVDAACQCSAYHPDRLPEPPASHEEVLALSMADGRVSAALVGVHALMALLTLHAQHGHAIGEALPSPAVFAEVAELLRRLSAACDPEALGQNPIDLLRRMAAGACDYAVFTYGYAPFQADGVRFTPVPSLTGEPSRGAVIGGTGLCVSAHGKHPRVAEALARLAGSEAVQTGDWPAHGGQPAHRLAWQQLAERDPFYRDLRPALETAIIRPRFDGWNRLQSLAGDAVNRWLRDHLPAASLYAGLQQLWEGAHQGRA